MNMIVAFTFASFVKPSAPYFLYQNEFVTEHIMIKSIKFNSVKVVWVCVFVIKIAIGTEEGNFFLNFLDPSY